jgi:AcrR family transcriptional regulator
MKRKQLIQTAKELFFRYGIKRVTVEEICREANVSKMTFYKHFKNKNELVKTWITEMMEENLEKYRNLMESDLPFKEKVKETINMKLEGSAQMSQEFFSDYIPYADPELHDFIHQRMHDVMGLIIKDYAEAQKRGDIRQDMKIEFVLWYLNKMLDLMEDETLQKMYNNPQDLIMEMVNFFFYGIMPRN